ncbi:MAG: cobyrinate a,c-diamide synthase [Rhodopseudomonas sp.]|nr:cobyrinate a,c-diamide synthase [Rhodopseudomonas sp.]
MAACPAFLFAAPASGQGKTSIVAALARLHARQGRRVCVFKCGPDFIDPMIHRVASGNECEVVDLWMCGVDDVAWRLARAARSADLIIVEGVMGLYDGEPSAADIATRFNLPVLAVIDASAMAATFGAIAFGLARYQPGLPFYGAFANRVGSAGHADMLQPGLPADIPWRGHLLRNADFALPERHLGLVLAEELSDLTTCLDRIADALAATPLAELPPPVTFGEIAAPELPPLLSGKRIAIARDAAFAFVYAANLECLRDLGAELAFFSPLAGDALPDCDAAWLPGGYPELYAERLSNRRDLWFALTKHVDAGKPLLAECGGMMALFETLVDRHGATFSMAGLLPGKVAMQARLAALGHQEAKLPEGCLRGHTFHYSTSETSLSPLVQAQNPKGRGGEAVYRRKRLTASYVHFYFPSNPEAVAELLS